MNRTITQIVTQKKHKDRCSIFLDEEFAFGLHLNVVLQFRLKKGDVLTENEIKNLLFSEEKSKAKERALNFLSYRDRSEKEVRAKLIDVGFEESIIDWVVEELKRIKLIDDKKFAMNFASSKMITRPMGEFLLKQELKLKGIENDLVEQTIDKIYEAKSQYLIAAELARKRKKLVKNIEEKKAKKRVGDFLLRRGFGWGIVSQVLEQWEHLDEIETED